MKNEEVLKRRTVKKSHPSRENNIKITFNPPPPPFFNFFIILVTG